MKLIYIVLITISFCNTIQAQNTSPVHTIDSLTSWNKSFSNNPFSATNRATPFRITKGAVDDLLDGNESVDSLHFQSLIEIGINTPTINNITNSLLESINAKNFQISARDLAIRRNLESFTSIHEGHELRIAYVGIFHAYDFYLAHQNLNINYAMKPIHINSENYTQ